MRRTNDHLKNDRIMALWQFFLKIYFYLFNQFLCNNECEWQWHSICTPRGYDSTRLWHDLDLYGAVGLQSFDFLTIILISVYSLQSNRPGNSFIHSFDGKNIVIYFRFFASRNTWFCSILQEMPMHNKLECWHWWNILDDFPKKMLEYNLWEGG